MSLEDHNLQWWAKQKTHGEGGESFFQDDRILSAREILELRSIITDLTASVPKPELMERAQKALKRAGY